MFAGISCSMRRRREDPGTRCSIQHKRFNFIFTVLVLHLLATVGYAIQGVESNHDLDQLRKCPGLTQEPVVSYVNIGWPYQIDCPVYQYYQDGYYAESTEDGAPEEFKCIVTSDTDDMIVHETNITATDSSYYSYDLDSAPFIIPATSKENNNTKYTAYLIYDQDCIKVSYELNIIEATVAKTTCVEQTYDDDVVFPRETEQGRNIEIDCLAKKNTFFLQKNYEVTWYRNCSILKKTMVVENKSMYSVDYVTVDTLQIPSVDFETTPGEYTCSVTYKGTTRFLSKSNVCVKHKQYYGVPVFHKITQETTKARPGEEVTLTCGGTSGGPLDISFLVLWRKNETTDNNAEVPSLCDSSGAADANSTHQGEKYECLMQSNYAETSKCYFSADEAEKNKNNGITSVNSSLVIKNFEPSDVGVYVCLVISTSGSETVHFTVEEEEELGGTKLILIIFPTIGGCLLLIIILLILVICFKRPELKQRWKKSIKKKNANEDLQTKATNLPHGRV